MQNPSLNLYYIDGGYSGMISSWSHTKSVVNAGYDCRYNFNIYVQAEDINDWGSYAWVNFGLISFSETFSPAAL